MQNRFRRIMVLLLAGAMLMTAGQGTYVLAGEDFEEAGIPFVQENIVQEDIIQENGINAAVPDSEETGLENAPGAGERMPEEIFVEEEPMPAGGAVPSDEAAEDRAVEDQAAEDWVAEDRAVEDRAVGDQAVEDEAAEGPEAVLEGTPEDTFIDGMEIVEDPAGSADMSGIADTRNEEILYKVGLAGDSSGTVSISRGVYAILRRAVYDTCYGNQLEGEARQMYEALKKAWLTDRGTGDVTYTLSEPIRTERSGRHGPDNSAADAKLGPAIEAAVSALLYDCPEIFWAHVVGLDYIAECFYDGQNTVTEVKEVTLRCGMEYYGNARNDVARFDSAVDAACQKINAGLAAGNVTVHSVPSNDASRCTEMLHSQHFALQPSGFPCILPGNHLAG